MGTSYKVILKGVEPQTYDKQINDIFEQVNQEMSTYLDTSAISQINNKDIFSVFDSILFDSFEQQKKIKTINNIFFIIT